MSENETGAAATTTAKGTASFTERELQMLGWAMQSLKTGPPEIDYEKLASFAGMSNPRSASNAWAKIKGKLVTNPDSTTVPSTPRKATGGRKKAAATFANDGDDVEATPKKTPRKRAARNQDVDGEASPKKKGPGRGKKSAENEEAIKTESDESLDIQLNDAPVKLGTVEENAVEEI